MKKVVFTLYVVCLASCSPYQGLRLSQQLQKENNFEQAMKENQSFTLKKAKFNYKQALKAVKEQALKDAEQAKIDAINKKIEELKQENKW